MTRRALWCTAIDDHAANLPHRVCSEPRRVWNILVVPRLTRDEAHKPKGKGQRGELQNNAKPHPEHLRNSSCTPAVATSPHANQQHKSTFLTRNTKNLSTRYPYCHNSPRALVALSHSDFQSGAPANPTISRPTPTCTPITRGTPACQPRLRRLTPARRAMNNYSFLDSSSNSGIPRSAPSPQQQQQQQQHHQQQQQQQQPSPGQMNQMNQMNGGGGQPQNGGGGGGVPLVNGLPSGGQQTDMNHLWSVVQQLSQMLEENKAATQGVLSGVAALQARGLEAGGEGVDALLGGRGGGGESGRENGENAGTSAPSHALDALRVEASPHTHTLSLSLNIHTNKKAQQPTQPNSPPSAPPSPTPTPQSPP